jgi:epoxyqueuosine reductase QueG
MDTKDYQTIINSSLQHGFDDAQIAPWGEGSMLVLFARYSPAQNTDKEAISVSPYYIVSNRAYANAGKLAEELCGLGIPAKRDSSVPAKKAALAAGGWIGKNGFYYHIAFGSLVHIQTVLLELKAEAVPQPAEKKCGDCSACAASCPCGAILKSGVDYSRCLRGYMNGTIPDDLKPYVYQLYGCEKCQTACPKNKQHQSERILFSLEKTIQGETLGELQNLAGKNIARYVRTVSQAILYAANAGNKSVAPAVRKLAGDERFADVCRYYLAWQQKKD